MGSKRPGFLYALKQWYVNLKSHVCTAYDIMNQNIWRYSTSVLSFSSSSQYNMFFFSLMLKEDQFIHSRAPNKSFIHVNSCKLLKRSPLNRKKASNQLQKYSSFVMDYILTRIQSMFLKHPHQMINILRHNNFYESTLRRDFVNTYLRLAQSCQLNICILWTAKLCNFLEF